MDKITLAELSAYLPYGISGILTPQTNIVKLTAIYYCSFGGHEVQINGDGAYALSRFKPILRPLSYLSKDIEHEGKKFTPLIELYRWSNEYNYKQELDYEFINSWGEDKILKVWKNRCKNEYTEFIYSGFSFRKDTRHEEGSYVFGLDLPHPIRVDNKIHNQYKLHQLLFEWHFDVFGLIDRGMAVAIESEVTNG